MIRPGVHTFIVDGARVPVTVRVSAKAKRVRLRVIESEIELVLPRRAKISEAEVLAFGANWLARTWRRLESRRLAAGSGEVVRVAGEPVQLNWGQAPPLPTDFKVIAADVESARLAFAKTMLTLAKRRLPSVVARESARLGLHPARVTVRQQATRWGSCSFKGGVSLNWRLVMAPTFVMDYVVVHELCHLKHMNHSREFWALVGHSFPRYREAERWLKAHGHELMRLSV